MLFLSPHLLYQITGVRARNDHGEEKKYTIEFFHGGPPRWAIEQAMENPRFHQAWAGLPDDQPREPMIAAFDTDLQGYDKATKETIEEALLAYGDHGARYMLAEPPSVTLEEPWRGYDATHHFQVKKVAEQLDKDSQKYALEYERANRNRPAVIAALVKLVGEDADVVVAA